MKPEQFTNVGELTVIAHEPAIVQIGDKQHKSDAVTRLLLSDETVIFGCSHPNSVDCDYTADNSKSITAHQRTHSDARLRKVAEQELQTFKEKKAKEFTNRSNGMKLAHQRRVQTPRVSPAPQATTPAEVSGGKNIVAGDAELAKAAQNVITSFNAMQTAADEFQKTLIGYMRMAQTASETPAIDPQILAKAQQYDILKAAMNGLNNLK